MSKTRLATRPSIPLVIARRPAAACPTRSKHPLLPKKASNICLLACQFTFIAARALAAKVATLTCRPACIANGQSPHWFLRIAIHTWQVLGGAAAVLSASFTAFAMRIMEKINRGPP